MWYHVVHIGILRHIANYAATAMQYHAACKTSGEYERLVLG